MLRSQMKHARCASPHGACRQWTAHGRRAFHMTVSIGGGGFNGLQNILSSEMLTIGEKICTRDTGHRAISHENQDRLREKKRVREKAKIVEAIRKAIPSSRCLRRRRPIHTRSNSSRCKARGLPPGSMTTILRDGNSMESSNPVRM